MKNKHKVLFLMLFIIILLGGLLLYFHYHTKKVVLYAKVVRIIDGDTFEVFIYNTSRIERIRLKCVDFPDIYDPNRVKKWLLKYHVKNKEILDRCYYEGKDILSNTLKNRTVFIIQDKKYERDKYNRLLGYVVYNSTDINLWLIENGYAIPYLCNKYARYFTYHGCLWSNK